MIKCPDCGAAQYQGTLFCSECGAFLVAGAPTATTPLPFAQFGRLPTPPPLLQEDSGPPEDARTITIFVPSSRKRVRFMLEGEARIGRSDADTGHLPELDLTEFDASTHGVSRLHALLQLTSQGVALVDLDSTNGTYLNNYRLTANLPYLLTNGDEVLFGDLLVHFFFEI